ncbi:MAG: hypothetical protein IT223_10390 [Crocinitomicaceae bacterium]|nr:hypothetical protein [Crocinitomicaceae bacterium]
MIHQKSTEISINITIPLLSYHYCFRNFSYLRRMVSSTQTANGRLILAVFILLAIFNLFYWPGKFIGNSLAVTGSFYSAVKSHLGLFLLLEFLAVASLFVDMIVHFDHLTHRAGKIRFGLTALLFAAFIARLILEVIDMYMKGY